MSGAIGQGAYVSLPGVYDIAKELGIDSKTALAKLAGLGEFSKIGSPKLSRGAARKLHISHHGTCAVNRSF